MLAKKYLSFTPLRTMISHLVRGWKEARREASTDYSTHDVVMSGLACMYFQMPSLLQFQTDMEERSHQNNLRTIFGVQEIPGTNAMKEVLDNQDSTQFKPIFKQIIHRLQRSKQLSQFNLLPGLTICSIDGTQYHSSTCVGCEKCLTKKHGDTVTFQHHVLQAALMHPDVKQVVPIMAEPIQNKSGEYKKQDCETNAAKRLLPQLRKDFPKMGLIITGDDLFSRQPMIEAVLNEKYHYFFIAKPSSHTHMMRWLSTPQGSLHEITGADDKGRTIIHQWKNDVPLFGSADTIHVNYFRKKTITIGKDGIERCRIESWVTDMEISRENVELFVRGAKTRWKIENECFNTLKNQGYEIAHNYGHGKNHLSLNFYLLTLLAFTLHQIAELCDNFFKACRKKAGSKRSLWEKFRTFISTAIYKNWEQLLKYFLNYDGYNIIDGYVVERPPPI